MSQNLSKILKTNNQKKFSCIGTIISEWFLLDWLSLFFNCVAELDKNASFEIISKERFGMITDSQWADIDGDSKIDLVMVGDWMPIRVLLNQGNEKFIDATNDLGLSKTNGLWNNLLIKDINLDGSLYGNREMYSSTEVRVLKMQGLIKTTIKINMEDFFSNKLINSSNVSRQLE